MTIKAILRDGMIHPLEPIPQEWVDGQELVVEQPAERPSETEMAQWEAEMDEAASKIPPEDHERLQRALEEIERESKEAVRREWGRS